MTDSRVPSEAAPSFEMWIDRNWVASFPTLDAWKETAREYVQLNGPASIDEVWGIEYPGDTFMEAKELLA